MAEANDRVKETKNRAMGRARETEEMVREYTEDSVDIARDLTWQVRDSYITSFNLSLSLLENNFRMIDEYNEYIGQLISLQQEIYTSLVDVFNPRELRFGRDLIERTFAIQRDYINKMRTP